MVSFEDSIFGTMKEEPYVHKRFEFQNLAVQGGFINCIIYVDLARCGDDLKVVDYDVTRITDFSGTRPSWVDPDQVAKAAIKEIETTYPPSYFSEELPEVYLEKY